MLADALADDSRIADPVPLTRAVARLRAWTDTVAPPRRGEARQAALDLLAVAAGLKPLALFGAGDEPAAWLDALAATAAELVLARTTMAGWLPAAAPDRFPAWYQAGRAAPPHRLLLVAAAPAPLDAARQASQAGTISVGAEAALLGFPPCCVAHRHRQILDLEDLTLALLARQADGDPARLRRLVAAGVAPTPRTDDDRRRLAAARAIAPQPWTSLDACPACAGAPGSPAARLGAAYAALAARLGWPDPAAA